MKTKTNVPVKRPQASELWTSPLRHFHDLREEMDRWMASLRLPRSRFDFAGVADWSPSLDAYEKDGELTIKADLPGLQRGDLSVTLEDGDLVIKGSRQTQEEVEKDDYYCLERSQGSFYRRMTLPSDVDPKKIKAHFKDGVLEVKVPVPVEKKSKALEIKVS